ncbi:MAG: hypothetical protein GY679_01995 [Mycoplasma sp.]|nr:hypothetical protein [Mycoplasma sp.]
MKRDIEELKDYSGRMAYELNELLDIDSSLTDSDREGICSDIDIYNSYYKKLSIILRCNKCSENEEAADINCESCKLNTTKESKKWKYQVTTQK